jgi:hypothetical protein
MRPLRVTCIALTAAAAIGAGVFARPAQADWGDGYHRWHPHDGWNRPSGPPALIVTPRPTRYAPSAAYYAPPPPAAYAPPPAYYAPSVSFDFTGR